jgi:hypothetical protein
MSPNYVLGIGRTNQALSPHPKTTKRFFVRDFCKKVSAKRYKQPPSGPVSVSHGLIGVGDIWVPLQVLSLSPAPLAHIPGTLIDKKYSIIITIDIVEGCDVRVLDMGKNWGITQDVETRNLSDFGKLEGRRFAQCQHGLIEMPNVAKVIPRTLEQYPEHPSNLLRRS